MFPSSILLEGIRKYAAVGLLLLGCIILPGQNPSAKHENEHHPIASAREAQGSPRSRALRLLRQGDTAAARAELQRLAKETPDDPENWHQIARSYLLDFYQDPEPVRRRASLALALEALTATLHRNPDHIPSLRAKAVIHARAELLHYDPNLAYQLASRVARLEPHADAYLLNLTEWMSGEVRFTEESGHRVPHDPLLGLDRSIDLLDQVLNNAMPFSNEETAAYFGMGKALARRGNYKDSILYLMQAAKRAPQPEQKMEALREAGTSHYRMGDFPEAARLFYEVLQIRQNDVDRWMLKTAMSQIQGQRPPLPASVLFPAAPTPSTLLPFEDVAPRMGIDRLDGNGTCAWGDFDSDGDQDLFLAGSGHFLAAYRNDGGAFTEVTSEIGLARVPSGYSLNVIDYDNDGRLDLYVTLNGWSGPLPNRLFRNTGGKFVDVSIASGAADAGDGFVSVWGDLDNDGFLDLVVGNGVLKDGSVPQVYRNNRNGTFTNVTKAAGLVEPPQFGAIGVALGDYDRDGDLDILINGLDAAPNRLYRNEGGWRFTEAARLAGVLQPAHNGFVCFFTDYNNDGWPDILTTSLAPWPATVQGLKAGYAPASPREMHPDTNRLFRNNGNGTFTDVTWQAKLFFPMGTMGAGVADLDNDGFVDFYFGTGDPQLTRLEPNRFFRNNGDGTFLDLTDVVGFARPGNKGHGVSFIDIDEDGDLDVYAQLGGHYPGDMARNALYKNLQGNRKHWLQMELTGVSSNRFGVGAQVTIRTGGRITYREVKGSEGFGATDPYRVHIGLGSAVKADSIEIRWPSGIKQSFADVEADQCIHIQEDQKTWRRRRP